MDRKRLNVLSILERTSDTIKAHPKHQMRKKYRWSTAA